MAPCYSGNSSCRYAELIRLCIPYNQVVSLDVVPDCMPRPPALLKARGKKKEKERSFTSLFRCYTHTHTGRSRVNLKGKGKKKADTDDGQKAKTAQGGRGTNGPPEPTYVAKRT